MIDQMAHGFAGFLCVSGNIAKYVLVLIDGAQRIEIGWLNLAQQDMVALRAVMRVGWQLPNPVNNVNTNAATRYPFAALLPAG